jgi:Flp pilus assembly protein TadG
MKPIPKSQPIPKRHRSSSGQALIEFALILPLLFLLIVNVINFGGMLYAWICVSNAARTGAQYYTTGDVVLWAPSLPSAALVQTLVMADLHPLPNSANAKVCVSTSTSATVSCQCTGTACPPTPTDAPPAADTAESGVTFPVAAVDVTYIYQPFIPLWDFPALRIHATLPRTAIHRQATMRILQ